MMPSSRRLISLAALLAVGHRYRVLAVTEYVGMAPVGGAAGPDAYAQVDKLSGAGRRLQPGIAHPLVKWTELKYYPNVSSVKEVSFKMLNATVPEVGAWFDLDLSVGGGDGVSLSAKVVHDKMYAYIEKKATSGAGGGCCADTLRIYDRTTGNATEWDLDAILAKAGFPSSVTFHKATHTFDVEEQGGLVYAFLMVQYDAPELNGGLANACVAFNTADGTLRKTVDGDGYFGFVEKIGVVSANASVGDTVYKVQYYKIADPEAATEEWHGNGMLRFSTKAGEKLLAFTHRFGHEAVIMKDPYTYTAAQGGGAILQRFGTPSHFNGDPEGATFHKFGVPTSTPAWSGGCHNVFYNNDSQSTATLGQETLSLFVNSVVGGTTSFGYEFGIKLTPQVAGALATDAVFDTEFTKVAASFEAQAQGGCRAIGNGVFIFADGVCPTQGGMLEIADTAGGHRHIEYPGGQANLYDPFLRVLKKA